MCLLILLATPFIASSAYAACSSPAGNAGDINFSSSQALMVYCNGTSWVSMGSSGATSFGTLTSGDICLATGSTGISCTTAALNLATQVTGTLPAADLPALTAGYLWVGNSTNVATGVALSGDCAISNAGAISCTKTGGTAFGTLATLATTGTASSSTFLNGAGAWTASTGTGSVVLSASPTFTGTVTGGTFAGTHTGSGSGLTGIGVSALGGITGTPSSSNFLRGDGTWAVAGNGTVTTSTAGQVAYFGSTGSTVIGTTALNINAGYVGVGTAAPTAGLTVNGTDAFQFGTNYSTTGTQSDVALGALGSSVRYTGAGVATFNGIAGGVNGQVLYLHNGSTSVLTLANQAAADTTYANQIVTGTGSNLSMAANSAAILQYDSSATNSSGATGAWRVIGGSGGSTTLAGDTDVTITSPASGNLLTYNGSKWVNSTVSSAVSAAVAPSFMVNKNGTAQTITADTDTLLTWTNVAFDTNNNFSTSTGKYTPTVAGQYLIIVEVECVSGSGNCQAQLYKNGVAYAARGIDGSTQSYSNARLATIVNMNGTTDYVQAYAYSNGTSIAGNTDETFFTGSLLAPLASGTVAGTGTANYIPMWSSSSNLTSSAIAQSGSNVGIGTTAPSQLLTLYGALPQESFYSTTSSRTATIGYGDGYNLSITNPSGSLYLNAGSTGNVAIGTTNSLFPFDVRPTTGGHFGISSNSDLGTPTVAVLATNDSNNAYVPMEFAASKYNFSQGNVGIGTATPGFPLQVEGSIESDKSTFPGLAFSVSGVAKASVFYDTTNNVLQLGSGVVNNGVSVIPGSGNVGIGTTNPSQLLHVYSPGTSYINIQGAVANQQGINFMDTTNGLDWAEYKFDGSGRTRDLNFWNPTTGSTLALSQSAGGIAVGSYAGGYTPPTGGMIVSGNVGIGTTSPLAGLDVENTGPSWLAINRAYGYFYNNPTPTGYSSGYGSTVTLGIYSPQRVLFGEVDSISDRRKKRDIVEISAQAADDFITKSHPVQFHWIDRPDGKPTFGFIAQDISKIGFDNLIGLSPNAKLHKTVDPDGFVSPEGTMLDLNYEGIIPLLTKALQNLKHLFDSDHDLLLQMKADNDKLRAEFEAYKQAHP